jgi:fluoride exporter
MKMNWVCVLGFGVLGVACRFAIDSWLMRWAFSFPVGTLAINVVGCFIAGLILALTLPSGFSSHPIYLGLVVGFCGGFTTFSGYGIQFIQMMNEGRWIPAVAYGIVTPILCLLSTGAGLFVAK